MRKLSMMLLTVAIVAAGLMSAGLAVSGSDGDDRPVWIGSLKGEDTAYLGVRVSEELHGDEGGARVDDVVPGSPAEIAGLRVGDTVVGFDGDVIRGPAALTRRIHGMEPGDRVELDILRNGERRAISVELGGREFFWRGSTSFNVNPEWVMRLGDSSSELAERYREMAEDIARDSGDWYREWAEEFADSGQRYQEWAERWEEEHGESLRGIAERIREQIATLDLPDGNFMFRFDGLDHPVILGVDVVTTTPELRRHLGSTEDAGVLVSRVDEDGLGARSGMQVGDLITVVDGATVRSRADLAEELRESRGRQIEIEVIRERSPTTLTVDIPEAAGEPQAFRFHGDAHGARGIGGEVRRAVRESLQARRELMREASQMAREAQRGERELLRELRDVRREAGRAAREARREAGRAVREALREQRRAVRDLGEVELL